jgi:predicted nucleic acid-binding protein
VNHVILDASVAAKLVLVEEFSDQADRLFADSRRAGLIVAGPPLLTGEVSNTLLQRVRRRELTGNDALDLVHQFMALRIHSLSPPGLIEQGFAFARDHGLPTIYDSFYVVLARMLDAELWTDDRRPLRAVGGVASWVRWIGRYPLTPDPA